MGQKSGKGSEISAGPFPRSVSLLIVSQPTALLLPLCLLWPVCLLVYFRRFSLKTELLCQDIAVFCNVAGPRCQKPAEINHQSVLFTTGCERVWNPPSVTSFKGAVRHFQCRVQLPRPLPRCALIPIPIFPIVTVTPPSESVSWLKVYPPYGVPLIDGTPAAFCHRVTNIASRL